jgi:hypothetical protein
MAIRKHINTSSLTTIPPFFLLAPPHKSDEHLLLLLRSVWQPQTKKMARNIAVGSKYLPLISPLYNIHILTTIFF